MRRWTTAVAVAAVGPLLLSACVEKTTNDASTSGGSTATTVAKSTGHGTSVVEDYAGERMSFGVVPSSPTKATGEPIKIGMINQEGTPLGSYPEVRLGAEAAVAFINEELGGVGGRPIELHSCITTFSVERSQACAQELVQADVTAVLGGIDVSSNGSIPVLEQNQVPYIGGVPVNTDEMSSPISFQFSGGTPGAFAALAYQAATAQGAKKVAVAYGDFGPITSAALDYGVATLKKLGVEDVTEVPFPITATDLLPVITKANEGNPDAIIIGAAETACAPAMKTAHDLGIQATLYLVGSCAAPNIATQVGEAAIDGRIFNVEGPVDASNHEAQLYGDVVTRYGDPELPAASAATVSFRSTMNLYTLLQGLGPDDINREAILRAIRNTRNEPSFNGHPYTCDGQQLPGLPAMCSPQEILAVWRDGALQPLTDWIDIPAVMR